MFSHTFPHTLSDMLPQENVQMMSEYLPLSKFKQVYVVDLCKALCEVAQAKVDAKGWTNVRVVEADACTFKPDEARVTLVTFSYSLSSALCAGILVRYQSPSHSDSTVSGGGGQRTELSRPGGRPAWGV